MSFLLYLLEAGLGLALFYGIFELLLRKETYFKVNRIYLIAAAGLSFAVPALRITSPFFTAATPPPAASPLSSIPVFDGFSVPATGLRELATARAGFAIPLSLGDVLLIVYAAGLLVCLFRRAKLVARLASFVRRGPVVRSRGIKVVSISEEFSPFSFLGYVFLNERTVDPDERRRILAHESVHVRQLHSLDVLLMELISVLQWFNPFVWPYRKCLQETHEYLADAGVIAQGFGQAEYQLLLLERHVGAGVFEFASNLRQSQIKRRILMLSKRKSRGPARLKPLLVLPLAALLALAFAEPRPAASASPPGGQEKPSVTIVEKTAPAKRKLEELRREESNLLKRFAETESLDQKWTILDKLQDILRAEEETGWILTGKAGASERGLTRRAPTAGDLERRLQTLKRLQEELVAAAEQSQDADKKQEYTKKLAQVRREVEEIRAASSERELIQTVASTRDLEHRLQTLKRLHEELAAAIEQSQDPDKKVQYTKQLVEVRRAIEEIEAAAAERGAAESAAGDLELRLKKLKREQEELVAAIEQSQDPDKKREYQDKLVQVRRADEVIKVAAAERGLTQAAPKAAELEKALQTLKNEEEELRAMLKSESDPERRAAAELELKNNIMLQKEIGERLAQLKKIKSEEIR